MIYNQSLIDTVLPIVKLSNNILFGSILGGASSFASDQDKEAYFNLDVPQRRSIMMAGINQDLLLLWVVSAIAMALFIIFAHKINSEESGFIKQIFRIMIISLFLWAMTLVYSTLLNLNTGDGDLSVLLFFNRT